MVPEVPVSLGRRQITTTPPECRFPFAQLAMLAPLVAQNNFSATYLTKSLQLFQDQYRPHGKGGGTMWEYVQRDSLVAPTDPKALVSDLFWPYYRENLAGAEEV